MSSTGGRNLSKNRDGGILPLEFAKKIAFTIGLWKEDIGVNYPVIAEREEELKTFQKMAISCSFKDSMIAYHGENFNEEIMLGLEIIHKATKSWLKGEVVGVLLNKMTDNRMQNKDFASSVEIIMDQLTGDSSSTGQKKSTKELIVKLTQ